ncbi:MAG: sigma-70 family RNA polymerase sigma factor [Eubacteriales bacterium]|nr:sigma-70 family RNA polymerase sigma factor [Eubacteriales bacterium]
MDDTQIVDLYWNRQETAISETKKKYEKYLFSIANHILTHYEDAEESVNDTYLGAWNSMPPHRPEVLSTFLGKITRRLALKKHRMNTAGKRGGTEADLSLEELANCIPANHTIDEALNNRELASILNDFLAGLPVQQRQVFVCRYWYCDSIFEIAQRFSWSESKVKMTLLRTREKLRLCLKKEVVFL